MYLTYRYDLRPTRAQYDRLDEILEMQRVLYNAALQERISTWEWGKALAARRGAKTPDSELDTPWSPITLHSQFRALTQIRKDDPYGYGALPANLCRATLKRVDEAFKGLFRRVGRGEKAGFPRYKPFTRWRSFGFAEFSGVRLLEGKLHFSGLAGGLKVHMHRPMPDASEVKSAIFRKTHKGWEVFLQVEIFQEESSNPELAGLTDARPTVGLDVGIHHFAALSNGEIVDSLRVGKTSARRTKVLRRALARCKRVSNRRKKVKVKLQRALTRIANRRKTYLHQRSANIARRFSLIAVENLSVRNMTRSAKGSINEPGKNVRQKAGLNREMLDVAAATFINMLVYKAERAGGQVIKVNPRNTSQICSCCGEIVPKTLADRVHVCACGAELDRDVNAARNILARAVVGPGDAKSEVSDLSRKAQRATNAPTA